MRLSVTPSVIMARGYRPEPRGKYALKIIAAAAALLIIYAAAIAVGARYTIFIMEHVK